MSQGSFLATRTVEDLKSLCPAAAPVGETVAGSGILCRVTGNVITTGENPSSLLAFCCSRVAAARVEAPDGQVAGHGYQLCPVWRYNRRIELAAKGDLEALDARDNRQFVAPAST